MWTFRLCLFKGELVTSCKGDYKNHQQGTFRLKIEIDKTGDMNYVIKPLSQKSLFTAKFQQVQTHYNERYIINKTTERQHLAHNHETDLILLYDEKGKILEFDIGNIMIEEEGTYYTPSYDNDFYWDACVNLL